MTSPTHIPPTDHERQAPGKALRLARWVIALTLFAGVMVFAVFAIETLKQGPPPPTQPNGFGASDAAPAAQGQGPIPGLTGPDPTKFIPILRPNPHPGEITPFQNADPFGQAPYRQPVTAGEVWEFCAYRVRDATPAGIVAHYHAQANQRGMSLQQQEPTSANMPGGIVASWSDGQRGLQVTAWPVPNAPPTSPPLKPATPQQWVVKYSYTAATARP